jgi:hypothetical protein
VRILLGLAIAVLGTTAVLIVKAELRERFVDRSQMLASYHGLAVELRPTSGHPWTPWELRFEAPAGSVATCDEIVGVGECTVVRATVRTPQPGTQGVESKLIKTGVQPLELMRLQDAHPRLVVEVRTVLADPGAALTAYERAIEWRCNRGHG